MVPILGTKYTEVIPSMMIPCTIQNTILNTKHITNLNASFRYFILAFEKCIDKDLFR